MLMPRLLRDSLVVGVALIFFLSVWGRTALGTENLAWEHVSWRETAPLKQPLANGATIAYSGTLFFIGGGLTPIVPNQDLRPVESVYYARIRSDGSLDQWEDGPSLPQKLAYHAAVATPQGIYVIGGFNGQNLSPYTYFSPFVVNQNSRLSLTDWITLTVQLPGAGLSTHTAILNDDKIYVIGGFSQGQPSPLVYSTTINPVSRQIGDWQIVPSNNPLPPIYRHVSALYGRRIYVLGGRYQDNASQKKVFVADIQPDGSLVGWMPLSDNLDLAKSLYFSAAVVSTDERKIFVLGGFHRETSTEEISTIYSTYILPDGNITPWETETLTLPGAMFRHSATIAKNGTIYLLGGKAQEVHLNSVYYIPPLGFSKVSSPATPSMEGDTISYTIIYTNNTIITQTLTITDPLPNNVELIQGSILPPPIGISDTITWTLVVGPRQFGQATFAVRTPLLPNFGVLMPAAPRETASGDPYVTPNRISCASTEFWMVGLQVEEKVPDLPNGLLWNDICLPSRMEITGVGMGSSAVITNPQTVTLPDPTNVDWLLVQMAGKGAERPESVTFNVDEDQYISMDSPTRDSRVGYTFEWETTPAPQIMAQVMAPDSSARALVLYSKRKTESLWTSIGTTANNDVDYQDQPSSSIDLPFSPLTEATDLYVTGVVIDNDNDDYPLILEAQAGEVIVQKAETGPTEGDLLNIFHLTLPSVPPGTDHVTVSLWAPEVDMTFDASVTVDDPPPPLRGDSGILTGLNVSSQCEVKPYTVYIEIPPGSHPSNVWILAQVDDVQNAGPKVNDNPTKRLALAIDKAVMWTRQLDASEIAAGTIRVTADNPQLLNAILLSEGNLPFDLAGVDGLVTNTNIYTQSFTFDIPSASEGEVRVLYPILDVMDHEQMTTVTAILGNYEPVVQRFTYPNMNDGLNFLAYSFPLEIFQGQAVKNLPLTMTVQTEDPFVWSLGPRVCRPVHVQNTAWMCSQEAGCLSATDNRWPDGFGLKLYLPVIRR